jgi:hypothetical protein
MYWTFGEIWLESWNSSNQTCHAGGMVFHALNRGVGRMEVFWTERDYAAFEETIEEILRRYPMPILAYCLMPTLALRSVARGRWRSVRRFSSD